MIDESVVNIISYSSNVDWTSHFWPKDEQINDTDGGDEDDSNGDDWWGWSFISRVLPFSTKQDYIFLFFLTQNLKDNAIFVQIQYKKAQIG